MRLLLCSLGRHVAARAIDGARCSGSFTEGISCQTLNMPGPVVGLMQQRLLSDVALGGASQHTAAQCTSCTSTRESGVHQPLTGASHHRRLSGSMASCSYSTTAQANRSTHNRHSSSTPAWWQRHRGPLVYVDASLYSQHGRGFDRWGSAAAWRGLLSHALAPKPLPRYRKVDKDFKWKRMVIRIPPQVQTELQGNYLTLSGQAGSMRIHLGHMDPTGLLGMQLWQQPKGASAAIASSSSSSAGGAQERAADQGALLLCVSPSKRCFRGVATHINNAVTGVTQGFLVGLTVKGVGYRLEPAEHVAARRRWYFDRVPAEKTAAAYPYKQAAAGVRLKVGYSYTAVFPLPEGVRAFFIRPNLMYLYGIDLAKVRNTAMAIRKVRPPNTYTGNGIQLADEVVKLRPRSGTR